MVMENIVSHYHVNGINLKSVQYFWILLLARYIQRNKQFGFHHPGLYLYIAYYITTGYRLSLRMNRLGL